MDYRNRKYYLVTVNKLFPEQIVLKIKTDVPSLKKHQAYHHFKNKRGYDGRYLKKTTYVQNMISCKNEESVILEDIFNNKKYDINYIELSKELLGQ